MRSPAFLRRPPLIAPLAPQDAPALAKLHALCFPHSWDSAAFHSFLADSRVFGFSARKKGAKRGGGELSGFILLRLVCGEAEILTFAVAPAARRGGLGQALLEQALRFLYSERAEALFLEVDEHNKAARALYRKCRFAETGRRKAYYPAAAAPQGRSRLAAAPKRADAILLEYRFNQANPAAL